VIGRTVVLDHWGSEDDTHNVRTIVGVLPPGFSPPQSRINGQMRTGSADALVPLSEGRWFRSQRDLFPFTVFGRLGPSTSLEQAETQLQIVSDGLASAYPDEVGHRVDLTPLSALRRTVYGQALSLLWGVVAAVLLIACLNVACLMLARSAARDGEFAVRASLGCSFGRITRQLLTEGLLIAVLGAAGGVLLALTGTRAVVALFPGRVAGLDGAAINGPVLGVTLLISLGTVGIFGWMPPLVASRVKLAERLKGVVGRVSAGSQRLLQGLIAAEAALALILFVGAGLFLNSFTRLTQVEAGFDSDNVLAVTAERAPEFISKYGSEPGQIPLTVLHDQMREAARNLAGVTTAAVLAGPTGLPFSRRDANDITVADRHRPGEEDGLRATWTNVDPFYFGVMRIPLLAGRNFSSADEQDGELVAIVSESAARQFWPDDDALGKIVTYGHQDLDRGVYDTRVPLPRLYRVVGVVGDVVTADVERGPEAAVYTPLTQSYYAESMSTVVMRPSVDLATMAGEARAAILAVDASELVVTRVASMRDAFAAAVAEPRFYTVLLGLLAATALVLVLAGIYGVVAYVARRRTYELGVRAALGARPAQMLASVLLQGLGPVALGLALGLAGSLYTGRFLAGYLFEVQPSDPLTTGVACTLVAGMALVASYLPARKAARVDPTELLRTE
jgi:putative ABC transport system permease protein